MPFQLARTWIEGEQRIAVEIVARAAFAAVRRRRIPRGPERRVRRGIVRAGNPRGRAADFPRVAFPGFMARLSWTRNSIEAPFEGAGRCIVRVNEPANAVFAAGD